MRPRNSPETQPFWSTSAFYVGWRFLNKLEVRDYIESEGYPRTVPFKLVDQKIPDSIKGKKPESVAWIAEDESVAQIFLDEDHLTVVRPPTGPVGTIPIEDIVELERGELRPHDPFDMPDGSRVLRALGLSPSATVRVSKLRITHLTKAGRASTATLLAERKICPKCGGKMSLVAAGWHCMKDDYLIHPTTNGLAQIIESRKSQKTSKEITRRDRSHLSGRRRWKKTSQAETAKVMVAVLLIGVIVGLFIYHIDQSMAYNPIEFTPLETISSESWWDGSSWHIVAEFWYRGTTPARHIKINIQIWTPSGKRLREETFWNSTDSVQPGQTITYHWRTDPTDTYLNENWGSYQFFYEIDR